ASRDVLSDSILGPEDGPFFETLKAAARVVTPVLPPLGSGFVNTTVITAQNLVTELAAGRYANSPLETVLKGASNRDLGAYEELRRRDLGENMIKTGLLEQTCQFARVLDLAHMST